MYSRNHIFVYMNRAFILLLLTLVALPLSFAAAQSNESSKLYVTVIEQAGDAAQVITSAKVSLAYGAIDGEQSQPGAWQDISTQSGQAVFSDLADNSMYTVSAKASGFLPAQKEFWKKSGEAGSMSIALTRPPVGSIGSVRVAVLVQAPQVPIALTTAEIEILRAGKLVATADTKNTKGKEGVVFSKLPIGEDYEARITAPGYQSYTTKFAVETNKETWLPIFMDIVSEGPKVWAGCPTDCKCDEQNNILYCAGTGITAEGATQKAVAQVKLSSVQEIKQREVNGKSVYEVVGTASRRLFFVIPVSFSVKTVVDVKTGDIEKVEKPWWSFLTW